MCDMPRGDAFLDALLVVDVGGPLEFPEDVEMTSLLQIGDQDDLALELAVDGHRSTPSNASIAVATSFGVSAS